MKVLGLAGIVLVGVFAFVIGQRLSADAVGMALGVLFGVLAGIPAALLVLASGARRRQEAEFDDDDDDEYDEPYGGRRRRQQPGYNALPSQAPVIIFAPPGQIPPTADNGQHYVQANGYGAPASPRALPGPAPRTVDGGRAFKVIGEQEEWITEW
jgi:hypothetical protein